MFEVERTRDSKTGQNGTAAARAKFRDSPAEARSTTPEIRVDPQPSPVARKNSVPAQVPQVSTNTDRSRIPVITGEVSYKGLLPVDGIVTGQLGGSGGSLAVRQKSGAGVANGPDIRRISFANLVMVTSHRGPGLFNADLIVDDSHALMPLEVAVAVIRHLNATLSRMKWLRLGRPKFTKY